MGGRLCSENDAAAPVSLTTIRHLRLLAGLRFEDVVRLDWIQRALSVLADQLDRVVRVAPLPHKRQRHQEGSPAEPCNAVDCDSFLWLLGFAHAGSAFALGLALGGGLLGGGELLLDHGRRVLHHQLGLRRVLGLAGLKELVDDGEPAVDHLLAGQLAVGEDELLHLDAIVGELLDGVVGLARLHEQLHVVLLEVLRGAVSGERRRGCLP